MSKLKDILRNQYNNLSEIRYEVDVLEKELTEKDKLIAELREGLGMVLEEYVIGASQMNEFKYKYSHLLEDKE